MAPISFARGVPAPECLAGRRARRLRARRDRARRRRPFSRTARAAAMRRCASGSPSGTASSRRASSSRAARSRASSSSSSSSCSPARACSSRRRRTTGRSRSSAASAPRSSACRWTTRASRSTRSSARSRRARSPRSSTRSRPSRTRAAARSRRSAAGAIAELAREHDLLVLEDDPYGLVRYEGEAPPTIFELEGGDERRLRVVVLEDGRAGRPRRLLRPAAGARGADRGARRLDVHLAAVPDAGDRARVRAPRQLRAEPRARQRPAEGAARRDARGARAAHAGRRDVEPARGRLLHLARPPGRGAATCSRAPSGGRHVREGHRLLRRTAAATRSLRLAFSFVSPDEIADGRRAARAGYCAARRRRRRRSSCESRIPTTKPTARLSRISQTSDTFAVAKTKCSVHRLAVLEHERDRVRGEQDEHDQPQVELRLPVLLQLVGVDGGRGAGNARRGVLRGCVCGERCAARAAAAAAARARRRRGGGRWGRWSRRGGRRGPRGGSSSHCRLLWFVCSFVLDGLGSRVDVRRAILGRDSAEASVAAHEN